MKNVKNYDEIIEAKRREVKRLENVKQILDKIQSNCQWDCMSRSNDPDENGEYTYNPPCEDDWCYELYCDYVEIMDLIVNKYFK